jgi:hypothetical protein
VSWCGPTNSGDFCDLSATLHDASLCVAFYSTCADDWTIVEHHDVDTGGEYLYQHGQLVAIIGYDPFPGRYCVFGPPSFAPPSCDATAVKIPACP